ncbi:MAG: GNAT family N-acetyltransferase [Lachnospiraceae bacterium]|nr:GNAT family N-acetyltransferase [Candidatus Equihabitans merdae]
MSFRRVTPDDIPELSRIESASYPEAEAATLDSFTLRVNAFPECLWLLEKDDKIVSFISAMRTNANTLVDEMYHSADLYSPNGKNLMIFSVVTDPDHRHMGYAGDVMGKLIEDCYFANIESIVLTCKENLITFYQDFGFEDEGISGSEHGGVQWHQMRFQL